MDIGKKIKVLKALDQIATSLEKAGFGKSAASITSVMKRISQHRGYRDWGGGGGDDSSFWGSSDSSTTPPGVRARKPISYFSEEPVGLGQTVDGLPEDKPSAPNPGSRVIIVDQWHGSEIARAIKKNPIPFEIIWDDNEALEKFTGGDTKAIKALFGGNFVRLTDVPAGREPDWAEMWFAEDADGNMFLWKHKYDSSD